MVDYRSPAWQHRPPQVRSTLPPRSRGNSSARRDGSVRHPAPRRRCSPRWSRRPAPVSGRTRLDAVQRPRQPIGDVVGQVLARQDKAPGADRVDRRVLVRIAAGRHRQRLEKGVLGPDARDLVGVRRDEARAAGLCRHRREAGPADAGAPEGRDPSVQHHRRAVAGAVEIDRLENPRPASGRDRRACSATGSAGRSPCAPNATGWPTRSRMVLYGLSARTTNMPGLEYIAVRIFRSRSRGRPMPMKAS